MSMISELVEKLRGKSYCVMFPPEFRRLLAQAADTIEELSAKLSASQMERSSQYYHGGWILCEKRMPEIRRPVLVTDKQGNVCIRAITSQIGGKKYWSQNKNDVIAWRPLPEPYREVRDETD